MKAYEFFISKNDVERIHENVIRILSEVGVKFENEKALNIFKKHGAKVDGEIVYIHKEMLEDAINIAPERFKIYSNIKSDVEVGGGSMLTTGISNNIYIQEDGQIRKMTDEDTIAQFKINETSPVTNCARLNFLADNSGCSEEEKAFSTLAMVLKYSSKYHFTGRVNTLGMPSEKVYDIARKGYQIVKRFEGLEDKPVIVEGVNPLSPLAYDHDPIEKLFALCDEGQAIWITPCSMPLLTASASVAGTLSATTAEALAGIVLAELTRPGTPVIFGNTSGSTNMRTIQLCIGAPEAALINYATAALADYYKLPFRTGGALSDAKDFDAQAGAESMMMLHSTLSCKPDFVLHFSGTMGTFNVVSYEKYILDEEIINMVQRQLRGIDCSEEKLCFDEIQKVGPRGNFLRGRTPKMYREEFYMAKLFNKQDPIQWQTDGSLSVREVAKNKIKERLQSYTIPERTKEQLELLNQYIPSKYREKI